MWWTKRKMSTPVEEVVEAAKRRWSRDPLTAREETTLRGALARIPEFNSRESLLVRGRSSSYLDLQPVAIKAVRQKRPLLFASLQPPLGEEIELLRKIYFYAVADRLFERNVVGAARDRLQHSSEWNSRDPAAWRQLYERSLDE